MISTKIVKVDSVAPNGNYLYEAADILQRGGLVIIPTETVYGIAANALNPKTIERLYEIKKRARDKALSLLIDKKEITEDYAIDIPVSAYKLVDKFWPGPLTVILKAKEKLRWGTQVRGERSQTIGMRMPDSSIALKIISLAQVPLVCPSANLSGKTPPADFKEALKDFNGLVDLAIDAGATRLGVESSVVDLTIEPLQILREGAIKKDQIEDVAKKKIILFVCTGNSCRSVMAKGLLEKKLKENGRQDVLVLSAGIMMLEGLGVTNETKELLAREGIDVSSHSSQRITEDTLKKSDIIFIMERLHEGRILELAPEVKNRVFLLKEFAKINSNNLDVEDPIGRSKEFYEQTFAIIKEAMGRMVRII